MRAQKITYVGGTVTMVLAVFLVLFINATRTEAMISADDINCGMIGSVGPVEFCNDEGGSGDGGGGDDSGGGNEEGGGDTGGEDDSSGGGTDGAGGDDGSDTSTTAPTTSGGGGGGGSYGGGSMPNGQVLGVTTVPQGAACDQYITAFIKPNGDNDTEQVYRLQALLKTFEGAGLELTGVYDEASITAVHAFQTKYATEILAPWGVEQSTGFVYLTTRKKMNEVYCDQGTSFPLTVEEEQIIEKTKFPTAVAAAASVAMPPVAPHEEEPENDAVSSDEEVSDVPVVKNPSSVFGDFFRSLFDRFR